MNRILKISNMMYNDQAPSQKHKTKQVLNSNYAGTVANIKVWGIITLHYFPAVQQRNTELLVKSSTCPLNPKFWRPNGPRFIITYLP